MKRLINNPIKRFDFVQKLEWFLISAVTMILVIRTQLWLTHYPQLGGNGLHIAHLLYGGIFMLIAIWFALIYINRWGRSTAAIIGGIGFGFFIDELGKFITSDNDYFYKPAAGIIYIIFVVLFLIIREMSRRQKLDSQTALANALSFMPVTVTGEFRRDEHEKATRLLDQADQSDPRVARAREYFAEVALAPTKPPSKAAEVVARIHGWITALAEKPWFGRAVVDVVIVWGVVLFLGGIDLQFDFGAQEHSSIDVPEESVDLVGVVRSLSIMASVVFVGIGIYKIRRGDRQAAYRNFSRALLVSIFITRVTSFIESQFGAVIGLGFDLILLAAVSELASQDRQGKKRFDGSGDSGSGNRQTEADGEEAQPQAASGEG